MEEVITEGPLCKSKIIESIKTAKKSVSVAMAYFTDKEIANELLNSKEKGLDVHVVLASDPTNEQVASMLKGQVNFWTYKSAGRGIMHHKFCIIDDSLLLHGSYNYTYNALNKNQEALNVTDSYNLISKYSEIFADLQSNAESDAGKPDDSVALNSKYDNDYLEKFTDLLKNQISQIFDDYDHHKIVEEGRKLSEDNSGQDKVFVAYMDSALARVNTKLNQDDTTRTIVKTKMTASLDRSKETNNRDLESDLNLFADHCLDKRQNIEQKIEVLKERKRDKQEGFYAKKEQLSKTNRTISELNDEIDSLDRQIVVKKFWTLPTMIMLVLAIVFIGYLSIFFGSAIWKILFEEDQILKLLTRGIVPEKSPLIDANAIFKVFSNKGPFYGWIAALFFLIPVLLTCISLFSKSKFLKYFFGWVVGIFVIDVIVAILISQHDFEVSNLLSGESNVWAIKDAIKTGEFWLIFIFGSLPLLLTKIFLENISGAYNRSSADSVDREKSLIRKSCKRKLSQCEQDKEKQKMEHEAFESDLVEFDSRISSIQDDKNEMISDEGGKKFELKERNEKKNKNLTDIYNSFFASVESGNKLFLENVIGGRITAFKQGYYNHIISYYSESQSHKRTEKLEILHKQWITTNFK